MIPAPCQCRGRGSADGRGDPTRVARTGGRRRHHRPPTAEAEALRRQASGRNCQPIAKSSLPGGSGSRTATTAQPPDPAPDPCRGPAIESPRRARKSPVRPARHRPATAATAAAQWPAPRSSASVRSSQSLRFRSGTSPGRRTSWPTGEPNRVYDPKIPCITSCCALTTFRA